MNFMIPQKFSVGGLNYEVKFDDSLRYGEEYGHWNGTTCTITLAHRAGGDMVSEERQKQTFFHELTHAVLDSIGRDELNEDEVFVDAFSNALYQAIKTMGEEEV